MGVDASPESRRAAAVAWKIAQASGMSCHLVHALPGARVAKAIGSVPVHVGGRFEQVLTSARREIAVCLHGAVPPEVVRELDVRPGRAGRVVAEAVARHRGDLAVVGGKRRGIFSRAVSGSTATYLVRHPPRSRFGDCWEVDAHQPGPGRYRPLARREWDAPGGGGPGELPGRPPSRHARGGTDSLPPGT